jgi:hypothetical protein
LAFFLSRKATSSMLLIKYVRAAGANLVFCISWTILLVILHCIPGTSLPKADFFDFKFFDKFVHFALFGSFVFFWSIHQMNRPGATMPLRSTLKRIILIGCLMGIVLEWVQGNYIPKRSFELGDLLVDVAGSFTVAYLQNKYGVRLGLFDSKK